MVPAPRCAQLTNKGDEDEGIEPGLVIGSEDCLAVDVYAPPDARGRSLPVMVWIHGGGNVWGRSSTYDGSTLAVEQDVVVVIPQYRVGLLGWFAHAALRDSATTPLDAAASFATLDLVAALRWVAEEIGAFGGDPSCVTILGQSSGGHNVATLLASPLAAGLFHRAVVQSGAFESVTLAAAEGTEGDAANPSSLIARRLGAATADQLRAASVEQLYAACDTDRLRAEWLLDVPRVIQDGVALPATPLLDAFSSTETWNVVPTMVGTTRDEMKLFYAGEGRMTRKRLGVLVVPREQPFYDAMADYLTRLWRIRAVDVPAAMMVASGHDDVFAYRFDWDGGGRLLAMDFSEVLGAAHGFDIPFTFGRFEHLGDADRFLFTRRSRDHRERLSRTMRAYWTSFARDGVPRCGGHPVWPRYGEQGGGAHLRLDTDDDGGVRAVRHRDTLDRWVADLREDDRLDGRQRSEVVDEVGKWMFGVPVADQVRASALRESMPANDHSTPGPS